MLRARRLGSLITGSMTWDESGAVTKTPLAATIVNGVYVFED